MNWRYSIFLHQSVQRTIFNAISFLFSSPIANMAMILINFQQKLALVRTFQHFAIKFLNQKKFLEKLKECFKVFVELARKM